MPRTKVHVAKWVHVGGNDRRAIPVVGMTTDEGLQVDLVFESWSSLKELSDTLRGTWMSRRKPRRTPDAGH